MDFGLQCPSVCVWYNMSRHVDVITALEPLIKVKIMTLDEKLC